MNNYKKLMIFVIAGAAAQSAKAMVPDPGTYTGGGTPLGYRKYARKPKLSAAQKRAQLAEVSIAKQAHAEVKIKGALDDIVKYMKNPNELRVGGVSEGLKLKKEHELSLLKDKLADALFAFDNGPQWTMYRSAQQLANKKDFIHVLDFMEKISAVVAQDEATKQQVADIRAAGNVLIKDLLDLYNQVSPAKAKVWERKNK